MNVTMGYILSANKEAMDLFNSSEQALLDSSSFDFMVYRFTGKSEVLKDLEEWDFNVPISKSSYMLLYSNLCRKLRDNFNNQ